LRNQYFNSITSEAWYERSRACALNRLG